MTGRRLALSVAIALFAAGSATAVSSQSTVYKPGDGVTLPVPIEEHRAEYTAEALQQGVQGSVFMDVVVGATGDVTDVTVSKSLDAEYGLDEQAVKAMRRWKFKPGSKDGQPVAVQVEVEMRFTLK